MNENTSDTSSFPDALGPIAESFLARLRRGEHPSVQEYADRFPEHAEQIHEVFPALAEVELAAVGPDASRPSTASHVRSPQATPEQAAGPRTETAVCISALERLGDYRIIREIGGGGMGIVYEAEREALHSRVALKVMHPKLRNRSDHLRWFLREARAAAGLHHTNIVTVFDYGEHDGVCYYAMQHIAGHSLDRVLEDVKRLKRLADAAAGGNESADLKDAMAATDAATGAVGSAAPDLRSVTMGLLKGFFTDGAAGPARDPVAAMAAAIERTQAMPPPAAEATTGAASTGSHAHPQPELPALSLSASATSTPGSSWIGKSSLRYQREIARIGSQVADALDYAHKRRVIHRDIKPHNILLDALGNAWITDFGLAKLNEDENQSTSQAFAGTLRYMAPERLQGKSDGRDDIYALAATLYEFLALRPVFDAPDPHQLLSKIEHEPPTPLRRIDRQVHPDLAAIIERSLAKDPSDRYCSAAELRDELRRFLEGRPVKTRPVPTYARLWKWCKRNPWLAAANISALALTVALAIGSTIAAMVYRDKNEQLSEQAHQLKLSEVGLRIKDRDSLKRLCESLVSQASARRFSRRMGQRFESLKALREAAALAKQLKLPANKIDELRDEAIASMALPDLEPTGRVITEPPNCVGSSAFAFDSKISRLAVRFRDGTVSVRRFSDDQELARFQVRGDRDFWVFGFSPDGHYLATEDGAGRTLKVWDVDRRRLVVDDPGPINNAAATFSPDSRRIAVGHGDSELLVYDLATGQPSRRWRLPAPAQNPAFRGDGAQIAVPHRAEKDWSCRIFDVETGRIVRTIPLPAHATIAWSPDGATLATPCGDHKIYVWDAATGARKATLQGHTNEGLRAVFHPAGTLLASDGWEGRLWFWDPVLGRPWLSLSGGFTSSGFSKDGRIVVYAADKLTTYQVDPALEYRTWAHGSSKLTGCHEPSVRCDGRVLAVGTRQGVVLWDLASGTELVSLPIGLAWHVMFEPTGDLLTSGALGVQRWPIQLDLARGVFRIGPPRRLPLPSGDCGIGSDRSGRIVALAAHDFVFLATPERTTRIGPLDDCRGVSISPDGRWLSTNTQHWGGRVWRVRDATEVVDLPIHGLFSPDGKWLMASEGGGGRLWEVGTWREVRTIQGGKSFSPDGRLVVTVDGNVLGLVETETSRTLARLASPDLCAVGFLTFSPDGSRLVVTTSDGPAVHVWDLRAIRRRLAEMGLDWDAPAYPEYDPARADSPPLPPLQVDYGPLAKHM